MIIYKTTNLINGKIYIGKDSKNNPNYLGSGNLIKLAINKYGRENFKKEILEVCINNNELSEKERFWIDKLNSINKKIGYNLSEGGIGGCLGCKRSDETKLKITGENNPFFGKKHSDESKSKIGKIHKGKVGPNSGKVLSEETKTKISNSKLGLVPWNKGKTNVYNEERLENLRNSSLGNSNFLGGKHTDETKKIISEKAKNRYTIETHPSFIDLPKDILIEKLKSDTIKNTAIYFNVSVGCIRKRMKLYNIVDRKIISEKHGLFKIISDEIFNQIMTDRNEFNYSLEKLTKKFGYSANKIQREFIRRDIEFKKIK